MHGKSPEALFIVAKRKIAGPDIVSSAGPGYLEAKRTSLEAHEHGGASDLGSTPCPDSEPTLMDARRPAEGAQCPVCRTQTIVEYWVDDESWNESGLPPDSCINCFNQYGPDGAELKGLYARGSLLRYESESDDKEEHSPDS
jgi:Zn ribbon nucleic-acid-binding protein